MVFTARWRHNRQLVLIIIEHKAYADPRMRSQILRYVVHLRRVHRGSAEAPEPLVLPCVLYHDVKPMPATDLVHPHAAWLDAETATAIAALQPHVAFLLDDLATSTEATLRARGLPALTTLTLLCLAFLRHFTDREVLAAIDRWGDLLRAIEQVDEPLPATEALEAISWYLLAVTEVVPEDLEMALTNNLNDPRPLIMSTLDKARQEGISRGRMEGRTEGRTEGRSEGRTEGRTEGRAHTLLRLLSRRFGELPLELRHRVERATATELDAWTDRVLDVASLAALFAD